MTPLEAMARAIAKCGGTEWDCDPNDPADVYMHMARAALTVLRDCGVTEGMQKRTALCHDTVACCFRDLLDAAIEGE